MRFTDQKVIVAGGTSGIGLATARYFSQRGAIVTVTGRNPGRIQAVQQEGIVAKAVDSSDRAALDVFFAGHGPVDHLIIAAGGAKGMGEFSGLSIATLREAFAEKFWPQLETLQAALPYLQAGGSVTLVTGSASVAKVPGISGLAAINGALDLMIPVLARELTTLRINAVAPGVVDTPWWDFLPAEGRPGAFAQFTANIPAKREAQPVEVADVIAFLAGNGYMTGKVVGVDGGMV
jgi:NAD(P)-dependent dehydrogenase (short-subunit alcohol dehydrogenase family)